MSDYVKRLRQKGMHDVADYVEWLENGGKRGRWYMAHGMMPPEQHGRHRCSECNCLAYYERPGREGLSNYCPECGAEMAGYVNGKDD